MSTPSSVRRITITLLALVLAGCGAQGDEPDDGQGVDGELGASEPSEDAGEGDAEDPDAPEDGASASGADEAAELAVVAAVAPVADLVQQVGGDRVEVTSLVPAGADAHSYEPRPQDVVALAEADAYLGIGLGLNAAAVQLAEDNLSEGAPVVRLGELSLDDEARMAGHTHDDDEDGHTHEDGAADHTHDDGASDAPANPHVWTSVRNAAALVEGIVDTLVELDPDGAEEYRSAGGEYRDALEDLDARIEQAIATIPDDARTLVTYHDAWAYFARDYGLDHATAVQPSDYTDPSASEVRAVIDLVRELEVPALFGSEEFPTPVLERISEETGATYVDDLADDVLPGEPGEPEHTYLELMTRNASTLVEALGGDADALR